MFSLKKNVGWGDERENRARNKLEARQISSIVNIIIIAIILKLFLLCSKIGSTALFQYNLYCIISQQSTCNNRILRKTENTFVSNVIEETTQTVARRIIQKYTSKKWSMSCHVWCCFAQYCNGKCQYSQNDRERERGDS